MLCLERRPGGSQENGLIGMGVGINQDISGAGEMVENFLLMNL